MVALSFGQYVLDFLPQRRLRCREALATVKAPERSVHPNERLSSTLTQNEILIRTYIAAGERITEEVIRNLFTSLQMKQKIYLKSQ